MTKEEFWSSNPRIIKVYEKIYREREMRENAKVHMYVGNYMLSALYTAIDGVLNGKKSKAKYLEKPVKIFPPTEEEKEKEAELARKKFLMWAGFAESKYKKGG
jgi:hypothetical protein